MLIHRLILQLSCFAACLLCKVGANCWIEGFSSELCCDPKYGPTGNEECWDDVFQYDPCCTSPSHQVVDRDPFSAPLSGELLDQALRPKILKILESAKDDEKGYENFLVEFEESLRSAITSPENRTISKRDAVPFLVVFLRVQGRHDEAEAVLQQQAVAENLEISSSGTWVGADAEGYHMHDSSLAQALATLFREENVRAVGDFGCGLGLYVRDLREAGFRVGGFDGNPATAKLSAGRCQVADLSTSLDFGTRWDWIMSLEVAEHIPHDFEATFLSNLHRHNRKGIVLSWGNQAGHGHVNLKSREEVEELLAGMGYESLQESAEALRGHATLPWFKDTILVFRRKHPAENEQE